MKIALIGPIYPYRGGIAQYTGRLAKALTIRHDVKVFSFNMLYPLWLYPGQSDKDPSPKTVDISTAYTIDSLNPLSWLHTAHEIRRYKPDLLIIEWWVTFLAPAFSTIASLCRRSKIKVIFLIHNVLPHEKSVLHRPLAYNTLKLGDGFIVHTSREYERLASLIPHAKAEICPFPLYDMIDPASLTQAEARSRFNLPEKAKVLLFFGIVRPYKGLMCLLEALALLEERVSNVYLVVAGEFWDDKRAYLHRIESLGLSEKVRLEDRYLPDEEVAILFRAADLAIAPYVGGTQSAVSALALGFGIPLVATEWSAAGIDEPQNKRVYVVPSGDVRALAESIQRSLQENASASEQLNGLSPSDGWNDLVGRIENMVLPSISKPDK